VPVKSIKKSHKKVEEDKPKRQTRKTESQKKNLIAKN